MPFFNSNYEKLKDEVTFLMIDSVDNQRETVEKGKEYIKKQGYTFPVYFDTDMDAAATYGINSLPTTLFINSNGDIVAGQIGELEEETLLKGIDLIKDAPPAP